MSCRRVQEQRIPSKYPVSWDPLRRASNRPCSTPSPTHNTPASNSIVQTRINQSFWPAGGLPSRAEASFSHSSKRPMAKARNKSRCSQNNWFEQSWLAEFQHEACEPWTAANSCGMSNLLRANPTSCNFL